jgi:hypothetical protein
MHSLHAILDLLALLLLPAAAFIGWRTRESHEAWRYQCARDVCCPAGAFKGATMSVADRPVSQSDSA